MEIFVQEGQSARWELKYFPVEVASRGFMNDTLRTCFKFFGLTNKETRKALAGPCCKISPQSYLHFVTCKNTKQFGSWELVNHPYIPPTNSIEDE